ncbi:MAG: response regulator [Myxococcales bacterium]|nr:response regulator [Myxococcales bacterium]
MTDSDKKQLGRIALKQREVPGGAADPRLASLSERHGVPGVDLERKVIDLALLEYVPEDIARQHLIFPIAATESALALAMANPSDRNVIDEIEFVTGKRIMPNVATEEALRAAIDGAYAAHASGATEWRGPKAASPAAIEETAPSLPKGMLDDAFGSKVSPVPTATRERPANPRILIVDDEDDIRRLLQRVLEKKGYAVIEASDGQAGLAAVREHSPDVILLDAMLPEVHGFDICRRIKGSKKYGHIPIIMVSAIYRGWRVAEDLRASYGVEAFLEKPFKINDIIEHVERALEGKAPPEDDEAMSQAASRHLEESMEAYRKGDLETAIDKLKEGIGIDPLSFQLHYHLGLLYGRGDRLFDAIHELETAVDLQARNFSALKNLAVLYQRAGFKHKAIEMWERALGTAPDDETRQGIKEHLMNLL